ncbi:uncharacterized protein C2845_PM05G32850 [Panicum miliaceum]|uniref:NAC domain-containing protein n=1 Tax=Panicum miliaceum TaxID=4540 RepID=A0A3L6SZ18_PANMI|nr:uncharacterized protein C2845_PM05G32850 [Panicum miliaceum]
MPLQTPLPPGGDDGLLALLRRKLAGEPLPAAGAHFHDADIYAADPATLTAAHRPAPPARKGEGGSWFFFTHVRPKSASDSRKSRRVGGGAGTWHSERAPRRVLDGEGNCVGHGQYFSYKRRAGKSCSARTDWYMVEFSEDQGADHERVRGGEPQLVLCKIYKAHAHSRSASGSASRPSSSASARKRKATDDRADLASAPVMSKRRLFDPPAPVLAVTPQEELSTLAWYLAAWQDNNSSTAIPDSALGSEQGMSHEKLSSEGHVDLVSAPVKAKRRLFGSPAPVPVVTSQEELSGIASWYYNLGAWQDTSSSSTAIPDSTLGSEPGTSQEKLSSEGWFDSQDNNNATADYAFGAEPEPSQEQDKMTPYKSIISFWMPETDETMSSLTAGDAPPAPTPDHCDSGASSPASWIGNDITSSCSRGWFLGAPTCDDELGSAGAALKGASNMCSMPSSAVSLATAPSWWCNIWSC